MKKSDYAAYADRRAKKSNIGANCVKAFVVGGLICAFGRLLGDIYTLCGIGEKDARLLVSVTLIFITAILTGFGIFDRIAKNAGAGTLVPITGFANAVVAPAIDAKTEGYVLGVGAKIFTVAGPVILYGTLTAAIYGVIYYIVTLFM